MTTVKIKERSWIARIAAGKLRCNSVAMVIGKTIYLHNATKEDFLKNRRWVRHELAHVEQYNKLGISKFLLLYLLEWLRKGYENNRFEVEARQKEQDSSLLTGVYFT